MTSRTNRKTVTHRKGDGWMISHSSMLQRGSFGYCYEDIDNVPYSMCRRIAEVITRHSAIECLDALRNIVDVEAYRDIEGNAFWSDETSDIVEKVASEFEQYSQLIEDHSESDVTELLGEDGYDAVIVSEHEQVIDAWKALGYLLMPAIPQKTELRSSKKGTAVGKGVIAWVSRCWRGYDGKQCSHANIAVLSYVLQLSRERHGQKARGRGNEQDQLIWKAQSKLEAFVRFLDEDEPSSQLVYEHASDEQLSKIERDVVEAWDVLGEYLFG